MNFKQEKKLLEEMFVATEEGIRERYGEVDPQELPPLVLAYIGDAYYHLFVRRRLLSFHRSSVRVLTEVASRIVSAVCQAGAFAAIAPMLTEEELTVYRRGRNAKSHTVKSASVAEYHTGTGFEALLGHLYLKGESNRLEEIADAAFIWAANEMATNQQASGA